MFRRRREDKTDYRHRLAMIKSGKTRLIIKRSISDFRIQFVNFYASGDKTVVDERARNLRKYGWKGHTGNISSAYLAGLLAGRKAAAKGVKEAVVDFGVQNVIRGSSLFAAAKGAKDAGISINIGDEALPTDERIKGLHIHTYAESLKGKADYEKRFGAYIKSGLPPEKLPDHFEETRQKIMKEV